MFRNEFIVFVVR